MCGAVRHTRLRQASFLRSDEDSSCFVNIFTTPDSASGSATMLASAAVYFEPSLHPCIVDVASSLITAAKTRGKSGGSE